MLRVSLAFLLLIVALDSAPAQYPAQNSPTMFDLFGLNRLRQAAPGNQNPTEQELPDEKQQVQEWLVWLGLYAGPIDGEIGPRSITAIKQFQRTLNQPETGILDETQTNLLKKSATRKSEAVGFSTIVEATTGIEIGLPFGLLSRRAVHSYGYDYFSDGDRIQVSLRAFRARVNLAEWAELLKKELAQSQVDYFVTREDWFVIGGNSQGQSYYIRFKQEGDRVAGFYILYPSDFPDFAPIVSVISLSFSAFVQQNALYKIGGRDLLTESATAFSKRLRTAAPRSGNDPSIFWKHGDSIVALVSSGNERKFVVEKTGFDLAQAGAARGGVLFRGQRNGQTYVGTAYAYAKGCAPIGFSVHGTIDRTDEKVTLVGNAPVIAALSCLSKGMVERRLVFEYLKFGIDNAGNPLGPPSVTPNIAFASDGRDSVTPNSSSATNNLPSLQSGSTGRGEASENEKEASSSPKEDDGPTSKIVLKSLEELLKKTTGKDIEFKRYVVDKKNLSGFRTDMPVLRVIFPERVFFDTDKAVLLKDALPVVQSLAATLRDKNEPVAVFVAGHTDSRGSDDHNTKLSVQRADAVANALVKNGVGPANIFRVGFGETLPVKPNDSPRNMALNRRVEFLIASQPTILVAWAAGNRTLCEGAVDCGGPTGAISIPVDPVGRDALPIQIRLPARATLTRPGAPPKERPPLPHEVVSRPPLGELITEPDGAENAQ